MRRRWLSKLSSRFQTRAKRRQRQTNRRLVCGVSLKFSEIRRPSTQNISRFSAAATIIRDYYPELTAEDIKACVQYAIDVVESEDLHVSAVS